MLALLRIFIHFFLPTSFSDNGEATTPCNDAIKDGPNSKDRQCTTGAT